MMKLSVAGGDASVILDVEKETAYCYGNQYAEVHELYGGHDTYVSRSGLSRDGYITRDANIIELGRYRVDAAYCTNPGQPMSMNGATVWALAPIANSNWLLKHDLDSETFGGAWALKPFVVVAQYSHSVALYFERKASDLVYRLQSLYKAPPYFDDYEKKVQLAYYDSRLLPQTLTMYVFGHELGCGLNYERFIAHIIKPQLEDCTVVEYKLMLLCIEQHNDLYFQRDRFGVIKKVATMLPLLDTDPVVEEWTDQQVVTRTDDAVVLGAADGYYVDLYAYNRELTFAYMPATKKKFLFDRQAVIDRLLVKLEKESQRCNVIL